MTTPQLLSHCLRSKLQTGDQPKSGSTVEVRNIFGDETLARLCEQVKEKIASVEPDALRPSRTFDPAARAQVKRDADELAEKFAGYFGTRAEAPAAEPVREAA